MIFIFPLVFDNTAYQRLPVLTTCTSVFSTIWSSKNVYDNLTILLDKIRYFTQQH